MRRKLSIVLACFMVALAAVAQNYTLTGEVEPVVHVGENFKLRFIVNSTNARNFTLGNVPDGLDVLYGPSQSTSISSVMVNGNTKTSETLTLTYVLSAQRAGKFVIPAASVSVSGHLIKSEPLTVQVIAQNESGEKPAPTGSNFFVLVTTSKKHVTEYEPFLLTYKVCWNPDIPVINLDPISLELQNVYMQAYNDVQRKSQKVENIGGRTLCTVDWQQYVVYPQKSGTLHIPAMQMLGYIREDVGYDPFDPFSSSYQEVSRRLNVPAVDIQVDALANKPSDYSGGVGHFTINAQLDKDQVKENTPITLSVQVKGKGNLNMLKEPKVVFPRGFDTYDTKQTENFQLTAGGLDGSVDYEFVAVPQRKGSFVIPPAKFVYFDIDAKEYKTLQTDSFRIEVLKGDHTDSSVHDFTQDDSAQPGDIHNIRMGKGHASSGQSFFASTAYYVIILAFVLSFFILFAILRYRESAQADVTNAKRKRANKVAVRKLRKAARLMRDNKPGEFYDETLRALWGYVGDKLNIPISQLSRENISQQLQERGVDESVTNSFIEAIDECEFVRYAPGDPQGNMNRVYEKSITAIEQIESVKQQSKGGKTLHFSVLAVLFSMSLSVTATPTKVQADEAFNEGEYEVAIEMYEELLGKGEANADVYYNLGNAYYRLDSMARAILSYERALLLQPGDEDARFNLQLARSKTIDKIAPEREMFFVTWYRSLVHLFTIDTWAYIAIISLAIAVLLLLVYFFSFSERLRRFTFITSVVLLGLFLLANLFAFQQKQSLTSHIAAIVLKDSLPVKNIPSDNGTDEFTIHAGTKVTITDDTMSDWKHILLPDGRDGWVQKESIEII